MAAVAAAQETPHNLPVLFQYADPSHSVAVYRGAELKQAIAAGLVPGFGNLGRTGKKIDNGAAAAARAAADAKAASDAKPSQLGLAEQACVKACRNLAGQCRNPFA